MIFSERLSEEKTLVSRLFRCGLSKKSTQTYDVKIILTVAVERFVWNYFFILSKIIQ